MIDSTSVGETPEAERRLQERRQGATSAPQETLTLDRLLTACYFAAQDLDGSATLEHCRALLTPADRLALVDELLRSLPGFKSYHLHVQMETPADVERWGRVERKLVGDFPGGLQVGHRVQAGPVSFTCYVPATPAAVAELLPLPQEAA